MLVFASTNEAVRLGNSPSLDLRDLRHHCRLMDRDSERDKQNYRDFTIGQATGQKGSVYQTLGAKYAHKPPNMIVVETRNAPSQPVPLPREPTSYSDQNPESRFEKWFFDLYFFFTEHVGRTGFMLGIATYIVVVINAADVISKPWLWIAAALPAIVVASLWRIILAGLIIIGIVAIGIAVIG